jgi:hypothetical protein
MPPPISHPSQTLHEAHAERCAWRKVAIRPCSTGYCVAVDNPRATENEQKAGGDANPDRGSAR